MNGNERGLFPCLFRARQCACAAFIKSKLFTYHPKNPLTFYFHKQYLTKLNLLQIKLNNDQSIHYPTLLFEIRLSQGLGQRACLVFLLAVA